MLDGAGSAPAEVLRAEKVDLARGGRYLLRGVDLTVRAGEHWTLLGPNGAGKSTLLGLLGAVTHPTRGTVRVLGRQLGKVDVRALRADIGHVNPRHPLLSPLTVREVVLTGATSTIDLVPRWRPSAEQERDADELIDLLGIDGIREARWPDLSQGERGRALVARALMPRPGCCCSTSRRPDSTWPPVSSCSPGSTSCAPSIPTWRASSSPTTSRRSRSAPRTPCCCGAARWSRPVT